MLPIIAFLACAGCLIWWAMLATQLIMLKSQVASLRDELEGKKSDHANILAQMAEARDKQAQLDQLEMYVAGRNVYGATLAHLADVMPIRVQITKIDIPEQPPQNLLPPGGKGAPAWGPTGTVEKMSMRITGRTTKETPVLSLMESLEAPEFTNVLSIVKDPRSPDLSPKVHSFRQDGGVLNDGSRLLSFDIEYRCLPRVFEKPLPAAEGKDKTEGGVRK